MLSKLTVGCGGLVAAAVLLIVVFFAVRSVSIASSGPSAPRPSSAVAVAAPTATTPARAAITLTNYGGQKTRPFELAAGNYGISWSAETGSARTANLMVRLERVDGSLAGGGSLVNVILGQTGQPGTGETQVYRVTPGVYYLDVMAPARWTVTLTPQP